MEKLSPGQQDVQFPDLAANIKKLRGDLGILALRQKMADFFNPHEGVGVNAIRAAERGKSMELKTVAKFSTYFGVELHALLLPNLGAAYAWPFKDVDRRKYEALSPEDKARIAGNLEAWIDARATSSAMNSAANESTISGSVTNSIERPVKHVSRDREIFGETVQDGDTHSDSPSKKTGKPGGRAKVRTNRKA